MFFRDDRAFTLIEVLLAITLLSVVLGAGYSLYFSTINTFNQAEKNWNMRSELERAGNYIVNELRHAFKVKFNPDNYVPEDESENYIFINDNGDLIHRQGNKDNGYDDNVVIYSHDNMNYNLKFNRVYDENDEIINNTLKFEIAVIDGMSIQSKVMAANIPPQKSINGQKGTSIYYKRSPDSGKISSAEFDTYCFIATAAYGTPMDPAITILRNFRDNYLAKFAAGKTFIDTYYQISPPIANFISKNKFIKYFVQLILYFVIGIIIIIMFPFKILPLFLLAFCLDYYYKKTKYLTIRER